ncbi:MAG: hypothetical protein HY925_16275, partial [Elusimicrobia bacterium]|nr:hypothetical protein [Elusimicrobiota bacterium]
MRLALAALCLLAAVPARAGVSASGYVKNLWDYTRAPLSKRPYWSDLTRIRAALEASHAVRESGPKLVAHADYDHEVRTGSFFYTPDYRLSGLREPSSYFDMEQTISTGGSYLYRHRLYRAWAAVEAEDWTARFGRQRIAWGSGKIWNPTDVLNPFDPTSIERDERRGVDAVYARRGLGTLGQAEAAWALSDDWTGTDLLGRTRAHFGSSDVALMGGKVAGSTDSWMAGGDFASNLWDGNFHGEWSYTQPGTRTSYWRGMLGYEYTLSTTFPLTWLREVYVLGEYYRNGRGAADQTRYNPAALLTGREIALARDYAGLSLQKELLPLVNLEVHQLLNL